MRAALLLLSGVLFLGACSSAPRGHVTLFNQSGTALDAAIDGRDAVTVVNGAHVRSEIEYSHVFFTAQKGDEIFVYRIPFDIWGSRHTDGRRRDLRLQIDDDMRAHLVRPDQEGPVETPPAQPNCFPLVPFGEWLRTDVRVHGVEPSRRSRYMYGTMPRPPGTHGTTGNIIGNDVLVSTGPIIWIKVLLKDTESGEVGNLLVLNSVFAKYIWWLSHGNVGWDKFTPPPEAFIQDRYVPFMQEHEDTPIEMNVRAFGEWALRWRGVCGDDSPADPFPRIAPYTLSELGFADRDEMLDDLFDFNWTSNTWTLRPVFLGGEMQYSVETERLIPLLLSFGFVVEQDNHFGGVRLRIIE